MKRVTGLVKCVSVIVMSEECYVFGHWLIDDNDTCVKCKQEIDLENDSYVRITFTRKK